MTTSSGNDAAQTFVLIHGAFQGGWCYRRVADLLRWQGHRVFTPTLSGLAERSRENFRPINLTTHINEVLDLFQWEEIEDVVLCGHSYAGMVVGGVADVIPERIRNLVYLDAVIPENGKSMADHAFPGDALLKIVHDAGAAGGLVLPTWDPALLKLKDEADKAMVGRLNTPQPVGTLIEKQEIGSNHHKNVKNHTYIHANNWGFPPIDDAYDRAKTFPGWKVFELDGGHDIMLDAPVQLAEILTSLD